MVSFPRLNGICGVGFYRLCAARLCSYKTSMPSTLQYRQIVPLYAIVHLHRNPVFQFDPLRVNFR